jgi:hypothetical protein
MMSQQKPSSVLTSLLKGIKQAEVSIETSGGYLGKDPVIGLLEPKNQAVIKKF